MMMTRNDAATSGFGLFVFTLLLVYFHRRAPPPQGGGAMVSVSSRLLLTDDKSAVPIEFIEDPPTGPIKLDEFRLLLAMSESASCAIPEAIEDQPTRRVAAEVIAPLAQQCQSDYLEALLLDIEVRASQKAVRRAMAEELFDTAVSQVLLSSDSSPPLLQP